MRRDGLTARDAEVTIIKACEAFYRYLDADNQDATENVCDEYFGLEPDYLIDLY